MVFLFVVLERLIPSCCAAWEATTEETASDDLWSVCSEIPADMAVGDDSPGQGHQGGGGHPQLSNFNGSRAKGVYKNWKKEVLVF